MVERLIVMAVAFGSLLALDGLTLRKKLTKREKAAYAVIIVVSLYLGADFVVNRDWFDTYDLAEPVFGGLAKKIDSMLKVKWDS